MDGTGEMFDLGQAVFLEGIKKLKECKSEGGNFIYKRSELIIKKRLAVVEFTHGIELILKAILIKKGYSIYKIKQGIFRRTEKVENIINSERTLDLEDVIRFFKREYTQFPFDTIERLRILRNQIIHRGTEIDEKKREYFVGAIDCLIGVYNKENIKHKRFISEIKESKNKI